MHLASQLRPDRFQRRSHPLLHRQAQDFEPTLAGLAATVGESKKVEGLRLPLATLRTVRAGKSSEFDQSGLVRMQHQAKLRQSLP